MATDTETIVARCVSMDSVLGAASNVTYWAGRAIAAHTKAAWADTSSDPYDVYLDAMANWTLHKIVMGIRSAGGVTAPSGPIQSKRNGDVSITYAISGGQSPGIFVGDFTQTTWGLQYLVYQGNLAGPVAL